MIEAEYHWLGPGTQAAPALFAPHQDVVSDCKQFCNKRETG